MDYSKANEFNDKRIWKIFLAFFISFSAITILAVTVAVTVSQNHSGNRLLDVQALNQNGFHRQYNPGDNLHVTWANGIESANRLECITCTFQFIELGTSLSDPELVAAMKARADYEANRGLIQGAIDWLIELLGGSTGPDGGTGDVFNFAPGVPIVFGDATRLGGMTCTYVREPTGPDGVPQTVLHCTSASLATIL